MVERRVIREGMPRNAAPNKRERSTQRVGCRYCVSTRMQIGQVISGKYRLLRLLGDGGMGSVYEAQHEVLGTRVAIKVLHEDLVKKAGLVDRFMREARVSAQIQNP